MADVTCPQCHARQEIDPDAEGYRCGVCAANWSFVRCTVCGGRFHTRPGTRAWTCPTCGTPHGRNRRGISRAGLSVPLLVGAILAIVAAAVLAFALGGDEAAAPPPTPSSPAPIADPMQQVCTDLVDVQLFRVDALGRAAEALAADAAALEAAGDAEHAADVTGVVDAIESYQEVAEGGGDTQAATEELLDALEPIDWC
jgi:hypothetical protein